ncbi:MAG: hypothetical protein NTW29_13260 [Bacteroidetes bacterium]|nr:hypothetical protein [Bacteroidota bacterium]
MENNNMQGFDLRLDSYIQKCCDAVISISTHLKKVIGILSIVTIFSFLASFNSQMDWSSSMITYHKAQLNQLKDRLSTEKLSLVDSTSLRDSIEMKEKVIYDLRRDLVSNYQVIHIPIVGSVIHINNLCLLAGLAFSSLMLMIFYYLKQEKNNLSKILKLISIRYSEFADKEDFKKIIKNNAFFNDMNKYHALSEINKLRRASHFDFLYLHELFNYLNIFSSNMKYFARDIRIIYTTYLIPYFVFVYIFLYDIITFRIGFNMNSNMTFVSLTYSLFFCIFLGFLTMRCLREKKKILYMYRSFKENGYRYVERIIK